jgi:hypothetical protein
LRRNIDHESAMRIGLLKRSLVAMLMLVLASAWQVVPSFAAQPCNMDSGSTVAVSHLSTDCPCKAVAGDCLKVTICCQVSQNLARPDDISVSPVRWEKVVYFADSRPFIGRDLKPDIHPPSLSV